jgi:Tfp pilus assembly protein PilO
VKLNRNLITIAVLAVVTVSFLVVVARPLRLSIADKRKSILAKQSDITQTMQLAPQITELRIRQKAVKEYVAEMSNRLPKPEEIPSILSTITNLASGCGVRIVDFAPQPRVDSVILGQDILALKASGHFSQILQFIIQIEQLDPAIWMRRLVLTRQANAEDGISAEISLVIFSSSTDFSDSSDR